MPRRASSLAIAACVAPVARRATTVSTMAPSTGQRSKRFPSAPRREPKGIRPTHSPFAFFAASAALVRARMRPRSYALAPSITVFMKQSAGVSPFPSPAAETTVAPAFAAARSTSAATTTSRAKRSRFATTRTVAAVRSSAASAAESPGRSSIGAAPETPWSTCQAITNVSSRRAHASIAARWASGPRRWSSVETRI